MRLWPFTPAVALALLFTFTVLALASTADEAPIPVIPFAAGFFLPFVTLACGLISFVAVRPDGSGSRA